MGADFEVSTEDVEEELNEMTARVADHDLRYPGMSYEEGVRDALQWVLGERDVPPSDDD